jgi:peptidoglycan/LPS O-acetylase OafA/YrhL
MCPPKGSAPKPGGAAIVSANSMLKRLTGVRAVAAIFVVFFHFSDDFESLFHPLRWLHSVSRSGDVGVDLFFILSGFILSLNYLDKFESISTREYVDFLRARLARVYPVHLFTLLLLGAFVVGAHHYGMHVEAQNHTRFTFFTNVFLVQVWPFFYHGLSWNDPSWSISAEWFVYLLFPLLALKIARTKRPLIWSWILLTTFLVASFWGARAQLSWSLLRVTCEFFAGCMLFRVYHAGIRCPMKPWLSGLLSLSICVLCVNFGLTKSFVLPFLALLIWGLADEPDGLLAGRTAVYWGQVSYSLYMTHGISEVVLDRILPVARFEHAGLIVRLGVIAAYLAVIALASVATFHLVEEPARKWLRTRSSRPSVPGNSLVDTLTERATEPVNA